MKTIKDILELYDEISEIEELDEFLEDCQVEEIDISELEDDYLFDAKKFMEQNHIMKSYLSFE